jgi:hypothetical protein
VKQQVGASQASHPVRKLKWLGLWLLQIPLYLVTSFLVRTLIGIAYKSLIRAGSNLPLNFLLEHFLWVGLAGGFIAGLIGLQLLRAAFLMLPGDNCSVIEIAWKQPQTWTWILPTCWLALGVSAWLGDHASHSVLASSTGFNSSGIWSVFFGSACSLSGIYVSSIQQCMPQLTFSHPWLGSIGYSAAAFLPGGGSSRLGVPTVSDEASGDSTQQEQIAH